MPTRRSLTRAELKEIVRALEAAQARAEEIADGLEDAFQKALVRAQGRAAERIATILQEAPDFKALAQKERIRWWIDHQRAVEEALSTSGYSNAVTGYVNSLPKFVEIVEATMSAQGESFIAFPKATLDFLKARQVTQFRALGAKANTALSDLLYSQVFGGASKNAMLPALKSQITGTYPWGERQGLYEWHAGTYARTNHFKFVAELDAAQAEAHGITENFLYVGQVDEKNRPFCRRLLAKAAPIYSRKEIAEMDNGFRVTHPEVSDVFTSRGGFNCRHRWLGVTARVATALRALPEAAAAA